MRGAFDFSDVDAERARLDHAERVARRLMDQRKRAYLLGRTDALTTSFDDEPTQEYP